MQPRHRRSLLHDLGAGWRSRDQAGKRGQARASEAVHADAARSLQNSSKRNPSRSLSQTVEAIHQRAPS